MAERPSGPGIGTPVPSRSPQGNWPPITYWIKVTIAVVITIAVLLVIRSISSIIVLLVIALVVAVGLEPVVNFLMTRARIPNRGLAVVVIFLTGLLLVAGFLALVVPALAKEINSLATSLPQLVPKLEQRNDWIGRQISAHQHQIQDFIKTLPSRLAGSFSTILSVTGKIGGIVFNTLTVVVLSIFFMLSLPAMRASAVGLFRRERRPQAKRLLDDSVARIGGYVAGNLATSVICGVCASIVLFILGLPFSVALGMWAGIADLIPAVGAYLGLIPAVAVGFSQGIFDGVVVLVYFTAYQQVENYFIVPRVMQNAVDMSAVVVLISTLIGASLAGFAGALLAIPLAATLKVVVSDLFRTWNADEPLRVEEPRPESPAEPTR